MTKMKRMNPILTIGLISFAVGNLLRLAHMPGKPWEFAAGFFLGLSIVLMVAGLSQMRQSARS